MKHCSNLGNQIQQEHGYQHKEGLVTLSMCIVLLVMSAVMLMH
jgi:competence protein ComGC